jgi:hypothetical protein
MGLYEFWKSRSRLFFANVVVEHMDHKLFLLVSLKNAFKRLGKGIRDNQIKMRWNLLGQEELSHCSGWRMKIFRPAMVSSERRSR